MTHARQQVRDAVKTAVTGLTTTGSRVFASRVHPVNDNELPCLLVFSKSETSAVATMGNNRRITRELTIMVEGVVKLATGYDALLDGIATQVEEAIYNNGSLKSLVRDIFLTGTEIKLSGEAEKPVAVISTNWLVKYDTRESEPETII